MDNNCPVWAVIPASGIGQRMQSDRPKQYLSFCGKTVLEHTLDRLLACPLVHGAMLILREDDSYWPNINYQPAKPFHVAVGGEHRQDSVINGLSKLCDLFDGVYALVHDAVRPLVPQSDLIKLIESLEANKQGALLGSQVADTLKQQNNLGSVEKTINRDGLWRAFTPQLFEAEVLLDALQKARRSGQILTDDSSAIEAAGYQPLLVEGSTENIKITLPADLQLAEVIWKNQ
ncbi:MAG: 2-C-methyl-D-erythritol 4-phosphate cytidylyltransferase [Gammaproteobacteria bacterium]|nr:2-C-methyl-D-erythritol 4-phosphate cytidylyltransferase [Gammaproteobacteria bacterium]